MHSGKHKYLFPVHPLLTLFVAKSKENMDNSLLEKLEAKLRNKFTEEEFELYHQQYEFLKDHSFLEPEKTETVYGNISASQMEDVIESIRYIVFEVTDNCNLKCTYCAYGECYTGYDSRENKDLPFSLAKKTLDFFAGKWKKAQKQGMLEQVTIAFYGGEPLLNFELISQVVHYCESLGLGEKFFKYNMTTNGLLLQKYQDFLIEKGFHLAISLDGNKENNGFRLMKSGRNSFDKIRANVHAIKQKDERFFERNVQFLSVVHQKNSFREAISYFKNEFGKLPGFSSLATDDVAPQSEKLFQSIYKEAMDDIHEENMASFSEEVVGKYDLFSFLRKNCRNHFRHFIDIYHLEQTKAVNPTGTCIPFTRKIFVTVNGKILPCERVNYKHVLGQVDETTGIQLDPAAIAAYFNESVAAFKNECRSCYNKNTCGLCAFKNSEEKCGEFKNKEDFVKTMYHYLSLAEQNKDKFKYIENIVFS